MARSLAAGVLFGTTFVVVKDAVDDVEPVPFLAVRFLIGAAVLAPFARAGATATRRARGRACCAGWRCSSATCSRRSGSSTRRRRCRRSSPTCSWCSCPVIAARDGSRRRPTRPTLAGVALATAGLVLLTGQGLALGQGRAADARVRGRLRGPHRPAERAVARVRHAAALNAVQLALRRRGRVRPRAVPRRLRLHRPGLVRPRLHGRRGVRRRLRLQMWGQRAGRADPHVAPADDRARRRRRLRLRGRASASGRGAARDRRAALILARRSPVGRASALLDRAVNSLTSDGSVNPEGDTCMADPKKPAPGLRPLGPAGAARRASTSRRRPAGSATTSGSRCGCSRRWAAGSPPCPSST